MPPVSLLIVDDSSTLRAVVKTVVRVDPDIQVVGEAANAMEARQLIKDLNPDVITLDIEMPGMSGLDFLVKIMTLRPMPVIMLSGSTAEGSESAVTALSNGAFHCLQKPSRGNIIEALAELPGLIHAAAASPIASKRHAPRAAGPMSEHVFKRNAMIAIGSSTGGVEALRELLASFPANCPPTLIAQHMPEAFIQSFAERLDRNIQPEVRVAKDDDPLKAGQILFAPGGGIDLAVRRRDTYRCQLLPRLSTATHCPSVDVLMSSVAKSSGRNAVATILTGMGKDGAKGLLEVRKNRGRTFGQDEATSTVYGMPRAAFENGAVETQLPIDRMAEALLGAAAQSTSAKRAVS